MVTKTVKPNPVEAVSAATSDASKPTASVKPMPAKPAVKKIAPMAKPAAKKRVKLVAGKLASSKPLLIEPAKMKKPKLVRDSFTMPKDEYVVIDALKLRAGKLGRSVKKSELLRAGIKVLAAQSDIQFQAALSEVPTIKTGRPKDIK